MKITIIYDNNAWDKNLIPDWGFACLVEAHGQRLLFDTGAKGRILSENMSNLGIDSLQIDSIFISHDHWDHTGGLLEIPKRPDIPVYVPDSYRSAGKIGNMIKIRGSQQISDNIFSTGELKNIEQSLIVRINNELVVVVGCAHPGVGEIIRAASEFGKPTVLIGGLHGFDNFPIINDLKMICPTHCTRHIQKIAEYSPDKYIPGGAGRVISLGAFARRL